MKKLFTLIVSALFLFCASCFAIESPSAQLQTVANKMIAQLENNKAQLHKMSVIRRIVNQILLPNVDLERMSTAVVGHYWRIATPAQRSQFEKDFAYMVTTTYAQALSSYNADVVTFKPLREDFSKQNTVQVNSVITRKNGQRIPISYDVTRQGNAWKVYDFSIEHISMIQSYRSQFADVLQSGGMLALLARLQSHNRAS